MQADELQMDLTQAKSDLQVAKATIQKKEEQVKIVTSDLPAKAEQVEILTAGLHKLAEDEENQREHNEEEEYDEKAVMMTTKICGESNPSDVAASYHSFTDYYSYLIKYSELKEYDETALMIGKKIYGEDHPFVAASYHNLAIDYKELGQHNQAQECNERALMITKNIYGEEHPYVAAGYHNLADDYRRQGKYGEAKECDEKALMIREKINGEEHPDVAASCNNLACDYSNLNEHSKARDWDEKALMIKKKIYGEEHPGVAESYQNLADDYRCQGQHNEAKECDKKALMIRKKIYGEEHPDIAASYRNLAADYWNQGQHSEAKECVEKALLITKKIYGEEHPLVAASYHNLADDYRRQGQYSEAKECDEKALIIRQKIYSEEHPDVAASFNNLACDYSNLGQHSNAEECDEKALMIRQKICNEEHPDVAESCYNLADDYRNQGLYNEAKEFDEKALIIRKKIYGDEHPHVAASYHNLADDYRSQGQYNEAKECDEKALMIRKKIYGEEHPDVAASYHNLALDYRSQEQHNEAKEYDENALIIRKMIYGEEHLDVAASYHNLALDYKELGQNSEVKECDEKVLTIRKKIYGDEHSYAEASYYNLVLLNRLLRQLSKAERCDKKAPVIRKTIFGEEHQELGAIYLNLANDCTVLGQHNKTKECREEVLIIGKTIYVEDHSDGSEETEKPANAISGKRENATASENDSESSIGYYQSEKQLQVREDDIEGNSDEQSIARNPSSEDVVEAPHFNSLPLEELMKGKPEYSKTGPPTAEDCCQTSIKEKSLWKDTVTFSTIVTSEGGVVIGEDVKLVCPRGAVDTPITVKITLEDPSKYYGLLVQRDLENDVMFWSPIINLQPNGHVFKKPVTLTAKLRLENIHSDEVLILHGTEARDGKITWQDITHNSKMDETNEDLIMEIRHFSLIIALKKLVLLTKDIVYRFNVLPFNYTMSVLVNKDSLREELALLFVSQDVYNEQFYQEHDEASALVQLKAEGFRELNVRSLDREGERRVYNSEALKVSVCLREDYHLADSEQGIFDFTVHSSVWWNTGEVFRLPLEWTEDVRILCGTISVQGGYGHRNERHVCEIDLCGYVRNLLGVKGGVFNLMPIAYLLKAPKELVNRIMKSMIEEDEQLEMILQHWLKENDEVKNIAALRKDLEGLKPEAYKVTQRGQMHIRHLRELATKISGLQCENADLMKYFSVQIEALCKEVLRDCCMQLEESEEGIQKAMFSTDHVGYIENRTKLSKDIARKCRQVCSSSEKSIGKIFLSIVPHLSQIIKQIFAYERILEVHNGLRGLCEERLKQFLSNVRDAEQSMRTRGLVCDVCKFLGQLCQGKCGNQHSAEIEMWVEALGILHMLNFLKPFFQHSPQDIRLHKRLQLFSRRLFYIVSDQVDIADEVFTRDFSDVSMSLIHFAKFSPSKLVRFELTEPTNSPVFCVGENNNNNENVQYDRHQETFSQWFEISKESEDELQLHASALVHVSGRICKKGAFQSVVIIKASAEEAFDGCMVDVTDVAAYRAKDEDSDTLRVVLCSTLRKKVTETLDVLKRKLSEEVVDFRRSEVTQCHLTIRSVTSEVKRVVRLRLFYKWGSEAIGVDSKDFVWFADSFTDSACKPAVKFAGFGDPLVTVDTASLLATNAADLGALEQFRRDQFTAGFPGMGDQLTPEFAALSLATPTAASTDLGTIDQLQRHGRILCGNIEYHLHQHLNHVKGNVCVVGDKTKLNSPTWNDQMPNQCALPEGPSSAPHRSITNGKRSQESQLTPSNNGT